MCTARIQKRLLGAKEYLATTTVGLRLTEIAETVQKSRYYNDLKQGLSPFPAVGKILYSAFTQKDEVNQVTRQAISTNLFYYGLPVAGGLLCRSILSYIPFIEDSVLTIPFAYLMARRFLDNTLYIANATKVYNDKKTRETALVAFNEFIENLGQILAKILGKDPAKFYERIYPKLKIILIKYFEDPELFRNVRFKDTLVLKATGDLQEALASALSYNEEAEYTVEQIAASLANAIIKIIFARLIPEFASQVTEYDQTLNKAFKKIMPALKSAQYSQEILSCINRGVQRKALVTVENSEFTKGTPSSPFKIAIENSIIMSSLNAAKRYLSFYPLPVEFALWAEFYGRGLLDLNITQHSAEGRQKALSGMKTLSFFLGLPFAAVSLGFGSFFLRDAILSLMMVLWTRAQLESQNPLPPFQPGRNHFHLPVIVANNIFYIAKVISPYAEKLLADPNRRQRITEKINELADSKEFDLGVALIFGDTWKHLKNFDFKNLLRFKPVTYRPKAARVLIDEIPSVHQYLKYHNEKISFWIGATRKVRKVPMLVVNVSLPVVFVASPFLTQISPALVVSGVYLTAKLLKKDQVEKVLNTLQAHIERSRFAPLDPEEQKAVITAHVEEMEEKRIISPAKPLLIENFHAVEEKKGENPTSLVKESQSQQQLEKLIAAALEDDHFTRSEPLPKIIPTEVQEVKDSDLKPAIHDVPLFEEDFPAVELMAPKEKSPPKPAQNKSPFGLQKKMSKGFGIFCNVVGYDPRKRKDSSLSKRR